MMLLIRRSAVEAQVEKEAEEPRPAPTGRVPRAVKWKEGLKRSGVEHEKPTGKFE